MVRVIRSAQQTVQIKLNHTIATDLGNKCFRITLSMYTQHLLGRLYRFSDGFASLFRCVSHGGLIIQFFFPQIKFLLSKKQNRLYIHPHALLWTSIVPSSQNPHSKGRREREENESRSTLDGACGKTTLFIWDFLCKNPPTSGGLSKTNLHLILWTMNREDMPA